VVVPDDVDGFATRLWPAVLAGGKHLSASLLIEGLPRREHGVWLGQRRELRARRWSEGGDANSHAREQGLEPVGPRSNRSQLAAAAARPRP
jgi:hypothetical protein